MIQIWWTLHLKRGQSLEGFLPECTEIGLNKNGCNGAFSKKFIVDVNTTYFDTDFDVNYVDSENESDK